ncbi:MAG: capsule biosynthesis protein, partial [Pseudomonadota bacterium]
MTTKPKARKFRIRRVSSGDAGAGAARQDAPPQSDEHDQAANALDPGLAQATQMQSGPTESRPERSDTASVPPQSATPSTDIDDIRQEGLTGRQLRMARRLAQRHGLAPDSDFEAVSQLRQRGIDPFQRSNIVELISKSNGRADGEQDQVSPRIQLPQTVPADRNDLPSEDLSPPDRRARDIQSIQRDIAARRRRRTAFLLSRLMVFVMLPTLIAGYYFYAVATPMYSTKSEFLILTADGNVGGAASTLLSGTAFATGQDSIATQSYLQSKDAMLRLDADMGFKSHFGDPSIDMIQRLDADASTEDAHALYKKYIKLGYDPTEG